MIDIDYIKTLIEIREFSKNEVVMCSGYGYGYNDLSIRSVSKKSRWILPFKFRFVIARYFLYQFDFNSWLNHECQNIEFEKEINRCLNLKSFY